MRFWVISVLVICGWLLPLCGFAQRPEKKDYIILADTTLSQGKILGVPTENNTQVNFVRSKRTPAITYSVSEVSEFRMSERVFFSKKVPLKGKEQQLFLEKLPHEVGGVSLWRLNGKPAVFFVASLRFCPDFLPLQMIQMLWSVQYDKSESKK